MFSLSFLPLPNDVCEHIEFYVNCDAINIIIKYYYKYINEKVKIIYAILNLNDYYCPLYMETAMIFSNASKVLSGNEDYDWWVNVIWELTEHINHLIDYSFINIEERRAFDLSIYSCRILANKFNILDQVDYFIYHQDTSTDNPY